MDIANNACETWGVGHRLGESPGCPAESRKVFVLRAIRNRLRALAPPVVFLAITYYFGWNALHGKSGWEAQRVQQEELTQATARFHAVEAQRTAWATKIADLSGQSIQPDMLDEQAREVLNLANPRDLVIELAPPKAAN